MPVPVGSADLAVTSLEIALESADIPIKPIVMVDGGRRSDFARLESFMKALPPASWELHHHEGKPLYRNAAIMSALEHIQGRFFFLMGPEVMLADQKWVGKMQSIFMQDRLCTVVDTTPDTKSTTLHPVRREHNRPPDPGCRFAAIQTDYAKHGDYLNRDVDFVWAMARASMLQSYTAWAHPGVRYHIAEHEEHSPWRERSELAAKSESPSPTIPDSSTPTTTETDGPEAFQL